MSAHHHGDHRHAHQYDDDSDGDSSTSGTAPATVTQAGNLSNRPPPKKRNRAALSCTLCRERKVRCDRTIPCQQCIKRGDEQFCHLDPNKRGPKPKQRSHSGHAQQQQGRERDTVDANGDYAANPSEQRQQSIDSSQAFNNLLVVPGLQNTQLSASSSISAANEVDAIKARLAQLEQVLAQQRNSSFDMGPSPNGTDTQSVSGVSPRYPWTNGQNSFTASPVNQNNTSGTSPFSSHRSNSVTSPSNARSLATLFAQQQYRDGSSSRNASGVSPASVDTTNSSTSRRSGSATRTLMKADKDGETTMANGNGNGYHSSNRGEVDSDTEDAALVLEGLAMSAECGGDKKGMKPARAALELIEQTPAKSIQGFVEEDKAEDIMTEGKYRFEKKTDTASKDQSSESSKKQERSSECEAMCVYMRNNPDAEFGPDGKRLSPSEKVCGLLSDHSSLFNLVYGPETLLGWGIGWAFPAAEAAGDMMSVSEIVGCKGALQREAVLRAIIRSLPQRELAVHLVDIFDNRVKFLAGNCFHVPTFRKEMEAFYDLDTIEKRARVINFVDPAWLSLMLMIFVLALHFHPCERPEIASHLFDGRTIHLWRSAARTCMVLARYQSSTSMAVLQTIILINLLAMGTGKENFNLTHTAISNALEMGLHRLGDHNKQPKADESPAIAIRREMAKRIWHQLTFIDWSSASLHAGAYRIHPHQFNTPLPGNYNDKDFCTSPLRAPRPESEHTDMSYPLAMLKLADISRKNVDLLLINANESRRVPCADMAYLDTTYRGLLEQAPSFYRIGSVEGEGDNIEVERWLYQQSVFHKLLRLHRPQLTSRPSARTSCVLLARSILDMQRRIRSRCSVVDRLFVNLAQSFSAAIVLCLDLLQTRTSATMRDIVRGEISEALKALRHVGASHHTTENSIRVIEALLAEEEARWNSPQHQDGLITTGKRSRKDGNARSGGGERRKEMLSLALRVAKATHGDDASDDKNSDAEPANSAMSDSQDMQVDAQPTEQQIKDQQSRQMFDQLFAGRPTFNEPLSFSNAQFQKNTFEDPNGTLAPNGDFGSGWTPTDGGNGINFDLSKFLAEAETNSSPDTVSSNASDSGHSSLHGGRAGSTSSAGHMSHSSSFSNQANANGSNGQAQKPKAASTSGAMNSPTDLRSINGSGASPSVTEGPPTGLDGFWNWILTQGGSNNFGASNGDLQAAPFTFTAPLPSNGVSSSNVVQPALSVQGQQAQYGAQILAQNIAGGMGANPLPSMDSGAQGSGNPTPNPFATLLSRNGAAPSSNSNGNSQASTSNEVPFYSVGTPSAGVGSSWMSTPGLFDLALEFGDGAGSAGAAAAN